MRKFHIHKESQGLSVEMIRMSMYLYGYVRVEFYSKNEAAKHVRLYFTWDKTAKIEDVINIFNKFDRIHITLENQKLIVE